MKTKVIIIHGMNNTKEAFHPLRDSLRALGLESDVACLPGHGSNRDETRTMSEAMEAFDREMKRLIQGPYAVVAFSQGALYFQLWMHRSDAPKPVAQVLLAPALFLKNFALMQGLAALLPAPFKVRSQTPQALRRYPYLHVWEYRNLFGKAHGFRSSFKDFYVPTLILADKRDELVNVKELKRRCESEVVKVELWERAYLRGRKPGKYHIFFHPDYFSEDDWKKLTSRLQGFINSGV